MREFHVRFCEGPGCNTPGLLRLVVMCRTKLACEQAEARIRVILSRLGLEMHSERIYQ